MDMFMDEMSLLSMESAATEIKAMNVPKELRHTQVFINRLLRKHRTSMLIHANLCDNPMGECHAQHCEPAKAVVEHLKKSGCRKSDCKFEYCVSLKKLLEHYKVCNDGECLECPKMSTVSLNKETKQKVQERKQCKLKQGKATGQKDEKASNNSSKGEPMKRG